MKTAMCLQGSSPFVTSKAKEKQSDGTRPRGSACKDAYLWGKVGWVVGDDGEIVEGMQESDAAGHLGGMRAERHHYVPHRHRHRVAVGHHQAKLLRVMHDDAIACAAPKVHSCDAIVTCSA